MIECDLCVSPVDRDRFYTIDNQVMSCAFAIHNELGRFLNEAVYQNELLVRCRTGGLAAEQEVRLRVSHKGYAKCYYLDAIVESGVVYELKAVTDLNKSHQAQVINYLMLAGLQYGKIINFRPTSVQSRFVTTTLSTEERRQFQIDKRDWQPTEAEEQSLYDVLCSLFEDWGAFLEISLYRDALLHFLQAPGAGLIPVAIKVDDRVCGTQDMCLLNERTAWHLSAVDTKDMNIYGVHLIRLLQHVDINKMLWINMDKKRITLKTLFDSRAPSSFVSNNPAPK